MTGSRGREVALCVAAYFEYQRQILWGLSLSKDTPTFKNCEVAGQNTFSY
jgi:hypothetical protein